MMKRWIYATVAAALFAGAIPGSAWAQGDHDACIHVGGVCMAMNKNRPVKDGWGWEAKSSTLILDNYGREKEPGGAVSAPRSISICVRGENYIASDQERRAAVSCGGNITIYGDGELNVFGAFDPINEAYTSIAIAADGVACVQGAVLNAYGTRAVSTNEGVTLKDCSLLLFGEKTGVSTDGPIMISGADIVCSGNTAGMESGGFEMESGSLMVIAEKYGITANWGESVVIGSGVCDLSVRADAPDGAAIVTLNDLDGQLGGAILLSDALFMRHPEAGAVAHIAGIGYTLAAGGGELQTINQASKLVMLLQEPFSSVSAPNTGAPFTSISAGCLLIPLPAFIAGRKKRARLSAGQFWQRRMDYGAKPDRRRSQAETL